jgi:hypothetical protein
MFQKILVGGLAALLAGAWWRSQRPGVMTEERDRIYRNCIAGKVPTDRMREIADAFEKERCFPQAKFLRQRIELRELPQEQKELRAAVFRKAMGSTNKAAVLRVAAAYESQAATIAASKLRKYASGLPDPEIPQPIITPPPAAPIPTEPKFDDPPSSSPEMPHQSPEVPPAETMHRATVTNGAGHVVATAN